MTRSAVVLLKFCATALAMALLSGCSPPRELEGRPPTPADASAAALLPPGRVERIANPEIADGAQVTMADGSRLIALRYSFPAGAIGELDRRRDALEGRTDLTSKSSVNAGNIQYLRYGAPGASGLVWVSGSWLFAAEARDAAALAALIAASRAGGMESSTGSAATLVALYGGALVVIVLLIAGLMRLVVRSLAVRPEPGAVPVSRDVLLQRLSALNAPDRPWVVRSGPEADLIVEWKLADASWWGILSKSGMRKAYRLRLYLDAATSRCGALDEFGEIEWSAGALGTPKVHFRRKFFRGIQIARFERGVAYGMKGPAGPLAKVVDYKFDIDDVKQPIVAAVVAAGWTYQPIVWPKR